MFGISPIISAQQSEVATQIEIVDGNGQPVDPSAIAIPADDVERPAANAPGRVSVKNENGIITIIDGDGNERVIDVPGDQSFSVYQSAKTIIEDGVKKTEMTGKAVIIGPDGQRHEIDLSGPINGDLQPGSWNMENQQGSKYMIGISCTPVSAALASQLKLETGAGLIVETIAPNSPAATAGLQVHDILLYADDTTLGKLEDLVAAVTRVGEEHNELSLTVIRAGKEVNVIVTPRARKATDISEIVGDPWEPLTPSIAEDLQLHFPDFAPGVIFGPDLNDGMQQEMQQQIEAMRSKMKRMKKMMEEQFESGSAAESP
jgi:hypothetical protein